MLRVKELRETHQPRLTQEGLAHLAGLTLTTVRRAEKSGDVSMGTLRKLAAALGVEPSQLFEAEAVAS